MQSDPIGLAGGLNTYGYVGGNPLRYIDPTGEQPICLAFPWGTGACAAALVTAALSAKSCSDGVDNLEKVTEHGDAFNDNLNDALDCISNPQCKPEMGEEFVDKANQNFQDAIKNASEATTNLATSIPNTSVTGPGASSIVEQAVNGTVSTTIIETSK